MKSRHSSKQNNVQTKSAKINALAAAAVAAANLKRKNWGVVSRKIARTRQAAAAEAHRAAAAAGYRVGDGNRGCDRATVDCFYPQEKCFRYYNRK